MSGKQIKENVNDQHKNTVFKDKNTANSSIQEESKIKSQITIADLNDKFNALSAKFNLLLNDITLMKNDNILLKNDYSQIKKDQDKLKSRVEKLEKKFEALESLVIRNNKNVDLLANRDSLKTLLLLFSVNLNVISINEIRKISKNSVTKTKFHSLVVNILKKLKDSLEPESSLRRKDKDLKEEITLSEEEKNKIKKKFIFVECIYFIVCSIDNIIHPKDEEDYSKVKNEIESTFENYYIPKNEAYKRNKEYYRKLKGKNDYKGEFFIQYLFNPNFENFSDVKMAINYQEFKDYSDKVIEEFNNLKTGVDPLDLIKQLKWNYN